MLLLLVFAVVSLGVSTTYLVRRSLLLVFGVEEIAGAWELALRDRLLRESSSGEAWGEDCLRRVLDVAHDSRAHRSAYWTQDWRL